VLKEKPVNSFDQTRRGLGYVTPSTQSKSESKESLPLHTSNLLDWESDVSVVVIFKNLFTNMTSITQVKQDEDIVPFDIGPWAQQLNLQWEKHFEQREPPTEDKVIQVDVGDQTHPSL